jgi:hypothetical protein
MHSLKGQMGGFDSNLPFCPPLTPLVMEVSLTAALNSLGQQPLRLRRQKYNNNGKIKLL